MEPAPLTPSSQNEEEVTQYDVPIGTKNVSNPYTEVVMNKTSPYADVDLHALFPSQVREK